MDKQNAVYPYNRLSRNDKKEQSTATSYDAGERWGHDTRQQNLDTTGPRVYDSTYVKWPE